MSITARWYVYALVQVFDGYAQQHPQLAGFGEYYEIGAVFNSPRACLRAETIARHVAFAAFSANDLTALTFGCERQDAEKFFPQYIYDKIYLVRAEYTLQLGWNFPALAYLAILCTHCRRRNRSLWVCSEILLTKQPDRNSLTLQLNCTTLGGPVQVPGRPGRGFAALYRHLQVQRGETGLRLRHPGRRPHLRSQVPTVSFLDF
jgi:hypothetical protein